MIKTFSELTVPAEIRTSGACSISDSGLICRVKGSLYCYLVQVGFIVFTLG